MSRLVIIFILTILTISCIPSELDITESTQETFSSDTVSTNIITSSDTNDSTDSSTSTSIITSSDTNDSTDISTSTNIITPTDTNDSTDISTSTTIITSSDTNDSTDISTSTNIVTSTDTNDSTDSSTSTNIVTSSDTNDSTDSSTSTNIITSSDTNDSTDSSTLIDWTTSQSLLSESSSETYEQTSATSITFTSITSTTSAPNMTLVFDCNFNTNPCFGHDQLETTNGSEFNPSIISNDTQPPRVPFSDVTSIIESTNNNETCELPYQPSLNDNSTVTVPWNMSFCYNQHCPTDSEENATCASGSYGLISLNASEPFKIVSNSFNSTDSVDKQLLRFYYYFTVYESEQNWNQQIQIWIKYNTGTNDSLGNLTIDDMKDNKWQSTSLTFQSPIEDYILEFVFKIDVGNSSENFESNETIYFALDNIELYDLIYPYTNDSTSTAVPENSTTPLSTSTTTTDPGKFPPRGNGPDLGMVIGLSVGIGVPVLFVVIGGIVLYKKKDRSKYKSSYDIPLTHTRPRTNSDIFSNPYLL